ncbi:unnamed protein product [Ectocarpus fasciculatus]
MAAESDISGAGLGEEDNAALVAAAHELRRKLVPPHQSLFRVVCILVYEDFSGRLHRITGTNAEASTIGASICAERAAMCKLREESDCKRVTKVVVVTDHQHPLAPGVLCREFLSAHLCPSTPVIMSGSGEAIIPGGLLYEEPNLKPSPDPAKNGGRVAAGSGAALAAGESAVATCGCETAPAGDGKHAGAARPATATATATATAATSPSSSCDARIIGAASVDKGKGGGREQLHVGRNEGAAPVPMDVATVGELYPWRNMYGVTERGGQLKLGFLVQQGAEELSDPSLAERVGLESGVAEAYDAAWRATAEDDKDDIHPIRYAAVALFSDGEAEITHQLKAFEYGATLDPVTLLAPAMMRRAKDGIRTSWVLLVDQFGNLHAPFAQARTFLSEHGFGETKVAIHEPGGGVVVIKAKELVPGVTTAR